MSVKGKRFIVNWTTRDVGQFKSFAERVVRLTPFGEVLVDLSALADNAFHIIPEGGSSWHEYSANWPTLARFFPHPKVAPHLPAEWIKANRDFLLAKVAVLRELKLGASFHGNDPHFWPESFWREHPHLRGPRIDHPRRSRKEEFSVCTDLAEGREMIAWEMTEFRKHVPELGAFIFNTNDAGSGFCWAAAQYSGPNGPRHCRGISAGVRVRRFLEALHAGARAGGGDVSIYMDHANFWRGEDNEVVARLPEDTYLIAKDPTSTVIALNEYMGSAVRGLINPLAIIKRMAHLEDPQVHTVFLRFGMPTHRGDATFEAADKALDVVIDCLEKPAITLRAQLAKLHAFCVTWAGEKEADALFETFVAMDDAMQARTFVAPRFKPIHGAISMRHTTRPLLFNPEVLTPEEEEYFLPYIFNIHESEARTDYNDLHGGTLLGPEDWQSEVMLERTFDKLYGIASTLEGMKDAPAGAWLWDLATSLRIQTSMYRSMRNFCAAQKIRDRHAAELAREQPYIPEKGYDWDGEGEILAWNERMRDEFDNVNELLKLLEERGTEHVFHAQDNRHQTCFRLGPDLVGDLKKKVKLMREHWLDVEKYLAPPYK